LTAKLLSRRPPGCEPPAVFFFAVGVLQGRAEPLCVLMQGGLYCLLLSGAVCGGALHLRYAMAQRYAWCSVLGTRAAGASGGLLA